MSDYFNCIDLDRIKKLVYDLATIDEAKSFILNEDVEFNPLVIKQKSNETKEAMHILSKGINVQFSGISCVNDLLSKADKGITLSGIELKDILVLHNHSQRIKKIFEGIDEDLSLKDYSDSINISSNVFDKVNNCIDNAGEIKDDASEKLKEINTRLERLESSIYSKAEQFVNKHTSSLQEASVFIRENRVTFLIKNSDKNKFGGFAYGSSASGLAAYVEPSTFIEMNNEKISLLSDKDEEIKRILNQLTYLVSSVSSDYRRNFELLMKLNVVFAKANYGIKYNAIIPQFSDNEYFEFKDLCHPLIDANRVVSNTYRIYEPYRGIVISGTNTGGKTVSLKAIGLSIVMSYLGIPIICSDAKIPFYKNIYVDIDDNQSISDSLSTFSAHISNINSILSNANKDCLILIDELISGTDPKEAQAISLAILDKIKKLESIFIITTHFDDIKNYSYNDEKILLSSVGFNIDELKPTYKYYENSIGSSNAIDIASRYFDDEDIICNARNYLKSNQTKQDELLEKLSKEFDEVNKQRNDLKELQNKYESLNYELEEEKIKFEEERINTKKKYIEEFNEYLTNLKQEALDKLNSIKTDKDKKIIEEIDSMVFKDEVEVIEFKIGDSVRIKDNEQIGTIISINGDKATIDIRGIKVKTKLDDLKLMPKIVKKKEYKEKTLYKSPSKEINLVGQRVEDGLVMMEEYLDRANAARLTSVKVIHGIGTGALRTALRNRIKKLSYVSSFKDGDFYDGGSAVTIVEFKR